MSGISIRKDLFIYLVDVISNSDLTSRIVLTEDIKNPKQQPNKNAESVDLDTFITDRWKWQDKSTNECHSPKYKITANL